MAGKTGEGALVELGRANAGCSSVRSGLRETDCLVRQRVRLSKVVDLIVPMAAVDSGSATAGKTVASREARRLLRCSFRRESNRYTGDQSVTLCGRTPIRPERPSSFAVTSELTGSGETARGRTRVRTMQSQTSYALRFANCPVGCGIFRAPLRDLPKHSYRCCQGRHKATGWPVFAKCVSAASGRGRSRMKARAIVMALLAG